MSDSSWFSFSEGVFCSSKGTATSLLEEEFCSRLALLNEEVLATSVCDSLFSYSKALVAA